ncbi:MAG: diacylglycerol kinase family lipid kinase [Elusimicrobiota bacterium]|nr:MAG: diacylglycerol kinase family lipid kinase [Elusimicrobiota bacterium]
MKTLFIVNPAAGHGRAGGRWQAARELAARLYPDMELARTERPGHARQLAREAIAGGAELVVAVGGDGTVGEVVDGYLAVPEAARRLAAVATFPAGSGCDFAAHMGIPRDPGAWAKALDSGRRRRVDAARAVFRGSGGVPRSRHFLNVAALGIPGDVAVSVARRGKVLGGTLTYLLEGALAVLGAKARPIRLTVDGVAEPAAPYHLVAVANTSTFGGGMRLAPDADAEDGLLDLLTIADMPRARLLSLMPKAYSGAHVGLPGVVLRKAARIEIHADEPMPLNLDGDADGTSPVVLEALPKAFVLLG